MREIKQFKMLVTDSNEVSSKTSVLYLRTNKGSGYMKEENIKIKINVSKIYPETIFYINWAKKSKNKKVKRRLAIKALKEFKHLSNEELKERVKQNISLYK